MGVKCVGFDAAFGRLEAAARALEDERRVSDIALKAVKPMVERVKELIGTGSPWKETGDTRADIHASIDKESEVGTVKVAIGATKKNAFKVSLQENGTSKQPPYPSLRPAHDETIVEVGQAIGVGIAEMVNRG